MTKKKVFDFDDDFDKIQNNLANFQNRLRQNNIKSKTNSLELRQLQKELESLTGRSSENSDFLKLPENDINYDKQYFLNFSEQTHREIEKEINTNANLLSSLTKTDYFVAFVIGLVGVLVDLFLVKLPKDINYLGKYHQKGSALTSEIKKIGDESGDFKSIITKLEKTFKVNYDASTSRRFNNYQGDVSGFYPKTHRMMSLGHDPFFGLMFGTLDIWNDSLTFIDSKGIIHSVDMSHLGNASLNDKIFAPLLWLGHLLSDACTKMGLPVPGWGFTQLLQFGSLGENDRTFADIARWMYVEGYDLRHFLTMSTVPGSIELLNRLYHKKTSNSYETPGLYLDRNLNELEQNIRLEKMLFISHSVAASGNVTKIIMNQGNPLSFNMPVWLGLIKQSVQFTLIETRNKDAEKAVRNRNKINNTWNNL